jgi:hypothetical protein
MKGGIIQVPITQQYLLLTYELLIQIWQILFVFYLEQRNHILIQNLNFQENTLRKDGLCSKIKLLLAEIGFAHVWVNQCTFSKSKLLLSLSIKLEDRYINHWKYR